MTEGGMRTYKGVDVSAYQGKIDWKRVKAAGAEFAILKVIRRNLSADQRFEENWQGCLAAGVVIQGVYNYTYAATVSKAVTDAETVLAVLGPDRHPFVWLDWEDKCLPTGPQAAEIINAYGDVITAGGCRFGLYFGMCYYDNCLDGIMEYIRPQYRNGWEARYYNGYQKEMRITDPVNEGKRPANFRGTFYGWQYTSMGNVDGIGGHVDLDLWYADIEAADGGTPPGRVSYRLSDLIRESRAVWGVSAAASAREIVSKTVTVSTRENRSHAIVTPLERYMKVLGYYTGRIEADYGETPIFGNGMKKAIILYQIYVVKARERFCDGELTAGSSTWKTLYGA